MIDAETQYEGKYAAAQQYMAALRATVGPALPDRADVASRTSTTTRGCRTRSSSARAARRRTCRRSTGRTSAGPSTPSAAARSRQQPHLRHRRSRRSARPTTTRRPRTSRASARCGRPTAAPGCRGGPGRRRPRPSGARSPSRCAPVPAPPPDPGWPTLAKGNKGDQVVWLQQHLASFDPAVTVTRTFDAATDPALRNFQTSRGLPVTGDDGRADLAGRARASRCSR